MIQPDFLIRGTENINEVASYMKVNKVKYTFVIDGDKRPLGAITYANVLKAKEEGLLLADIIDKEILCENEELYVNDVFELAGTSKYPLVIIKDGKFRGIVTYETILASLV
ncbi:MAG: CBS domain-containing protein [Bacilli bacterium]